uniref:Zn(2)-C6 fungal-type domain-containing protein n=1 Tax=Odontella aurita TaxID=265563 RepID=A0A7S4K303_9STRA|mmetsp:Transcript_59882/g.177503  ORF Transcript_59882/g.177503 Transcript_59882/m.177503 type:complete len:643 (+) Transcript_59882:154-2082(+)
MSDSSDSSDSLDSSYSDEGRSAGKRKGHGKGGGKGANGLRASCDRCRASRRKCDGKHPCILCVDTYLRKRSDLTTVYGVDKALIGCVYSPAKRRGPKPQKGQEDSRNPKPRKSRRAREASELEKLRASAQHETVDPDELARVMAAVAKGRKVRTPIKTRPTRKPSKTEEQSDSTKQAKYGGAKGHAAAMATAAEKARKSRRAHEEASWIAMAAAAETRRAAAMSAGVAAGLDATSIAVSAMEGQAPALATGLDAKGIAAVAKEANAAVATSSLEQSDGESEGDHERKAARTAKAKRRTSGTPRDSRSRKKAKTVGDSSKLTPTEKRKLRVQERLRIAREMGAEAAGEKALHKSCERCRRGKKKCDGQRPCEECVVSYLKKNKLTSASIEVGEDVSHFGCIYFPSKRRGSRKGSKKHAQKRAGGGPSGSGVQRTITLKDGKKVTGDSALTRTQKRKLRFLERKLHVKEQRSREGQLRQVTKVNKKELDNVLAEYSKRKVGVRGQSDDEGEEGEDEEGSCEEEEGEPIDEQELENALAEYRKYSQVSGNSNLTKNEVGANGQVDGEEHESGNDEKAWTKGNVSDEEPEDEKEGNAWTKENVSDKEQEDEKEGKAWTKGNASDKEQEDGKEEKVDTEEQAKDTLV